MTSEERQQAFLNGLNELQQKYGFQVGAQIQTRQLGPVVQCEPTVIITPIPDWQEPPILTDEEIRDALHDNGQRPRLEEVHKS